MTTQYAETKHKKSRRRSSHQTRTIHGKSQRKTEVLNIVEESTVIEHDFRWRKMFGNLLIIAGVYVLLFVGGLYVQIDYQRLAARGDNDIEPPRQVLRVNTNASSGALPFGSEPISVAGSNEVAPASFSVPVLNNGSPLPANSAALVGSTIERIVIPTIALDAKVIEVGWSVVEQDGQEVAVWDVAEFAVGHHYGSGNPGSNDNIVLAGHVGGLGAVFRDLYYVRPGEPITVYSNGQAYRYVIEERLVVEEDGAPLEQRAANAELIAPTDYEVLTLVTCWPPTGRERFSQRVVIRARPFQVEQAESEQPAWTIR